MTHHSLVWGGTEIGGKVNVHTDIHTNIHLEVYDSTNIMINGYMLKAGNRWGGRTIGQSVKEVLTPLVSAFY